MRDGLVSEPAVSEGPFVAELRPAPALGDAFERLSDLPFVLFLDCPEGAGGSARHAYLTASPFLLVLAREGATEIRAPVTDDLREDRFVAVERTAGDPLAALARSAAAWRIEPDPSLPPFQGGAAGAFGYGLGRSIERLPPPARDEFRAPDLAVGLYDWVLAFDRERGSCHLVAHGFPERTPSARRARAERRARDVRRLLEARRPPASRLRAETAPPLGESDVGPAWPVPGPAGLRSDFSRDAYVEAVERAIEKICAGDIFQVNLSQRLLLPQREPAVQIYRRLRRANPAPFGGFFALPGHIVASASPEEFLRLRGDEVSTRPIKGTRPRGRGSDGDAALREELARSSKDQAENVMIVDLLRNDLSRVARLHTVRVERLFDVETHPTVHHLVSEVRARLRDGLGFADLLRAAFPGGSVTGAPKIRAMETIAEIERHARGFYCGSLGWIGFDGALHLNIAIRTLTVARGWIQIPVGGAVTAPSEPAAEYQETLYKAAGLLAAFR